MSNNPVRISTNMCMYIKPTIEKLITASTLTVAKDLVVFLLIATNIYYIYSIIEQCPQHTPHAETHDMPAFMQLHFMV